LVAASVRQERNLHGGTHCASDTALLSTACDAWDVLTVCWFGCVHVPLGITLCFLINKSRLPDAAYASLLMLYCSFLLI
jgi:hypothetical protein